jgi:hypothetical protein
MYLWINMISVIEVNALLFVFAASPVINNKASCYLMVNRGPLNLQG